MPKYKIPMRRISNYVVEVDAKTLDEAIEKSWDQFGFTIQNKNPETVQNELIINEVVIKDNSPLIIDNKYITLENSETEDYKGN